MDLPQGLVRTYPPPTAQVLTFKSPFWRAVNHFLRLMFRLFICFHDLLMSYRLPAGLQLIRQKNGGTPQTLPASRGSKRGVKKRNLRWDLMMGTNRVPPLRKIQNKIRKKKNNVDPNTGLGPRAFILMVTIRRAYLLDVFHPRFVLSTSGRGLLLYFSSCTQDSSEVVVACAYRQNNNSGRTAWTNPKTRIAIATDGKNCRIRSMGACILIKHA